MLGPDLMHIIKEYNWTQHDITGYLWIWIFNLFINGKQITLVG